MQTVVLEGEVVEIREELDHRLAKIVFTNPILLDVTGGDPPDIHLGDRVLVRGVMGVEREAL